MSEAQVIDLVRKYASVRYSNYPTQFLVVEDFEAGWVVFPALAADSADSPHPIFLVGFKGEIMVASANITRSRAEAEFIRLHGQA